MQNKIYKIPYSKSALEFTLPPSMQVTVAVSQPGRTSAGYFDCYVMEFNINVFLLQLVTFLVGMFLSSKIFLPQLKSWMYSRQKRIEDQLATAEKRQAEAAHLKTEFEKKVKELEQGTAEILQRSRKEANQARDEVIQSARKEAELILADARKAIESERQAVTQALQKEVGLLAVDIAEKIIRSSVDAKVQEKMVKESIQELGARKN